ncbi:hypothetical protein ADUPG1_004026, partial [Aduncisulcus paluster]
SGLRGRCQRQRPLRFASLDCEDPSDADTGVGYCRFDRLDRCRGCDVVPAERYGASSPIAEFQR